MRVGDRLGGWVAWKVSEGKMLQASSSRKSGNSLGVYRCFIFTCLDIRVSNRYSALTDFSGEGMCCFGFDCRVCRWEGKRWKIEK